MILHTKYQGSMPCGFRQEDFFMFLPILVYEKHVTPRRGHFWPQGHNLKKLVRGSQGFSQEDFFFHVAPYISLCKTCDPGAGPFLAPGL